MFHQVPSQTSLSITHYKRYFNKKDWKNVTQGGHFQKRRGDGGTQCMEKRLRVPHVHPGKPN
jgi:hypothetical protein